MFISFEGIEGVGKTTHLQYMAAQLKAAGIRILQTREPGGTQMGEEIRDILLAHRHERVAPLTELLLMFAARAQHVDTIIRPALAEGHWVLCDRFVDATYAYQGGGRGVPQSMITELEILTLGDFHPDLTILLDAPPVVGLERVRSRGNAHDRFEQEKLDFFERVRVVYQQRAEQHPERYRVIDATKSLESIQKIIRDLSLRLIEKSHV
jgi:dTMP kinase